MGGHRNPKRLAVDDDADRVADGLPIGMQIIGGYLEDRHYDRVRRACRARVRGFKPPPNL
jgi:Asp-tRNA(Asn)/Glu-tRNA(Gln) amidotransferase A subunit family amidase